MLVNNSKCKMSVPSDLESWVRCLMTVKGIKNFDIKEFHRNSTEDGKLGKIDFVKATAYLENCEKIYFHIVVKTVGLRTDVNEYILHNVLEREILVYTRILPIFEKFQKQLGIERRFAKFPELYTVCVCNGNGQKAIIIEDLKHSGFEMHNKHIAQNLNHAIQVFENYGKFHGISFAIKMKNPDFFKVLVEDMTDVLSATICYTKFGNEFTEYFCDAINILKCAGKNDVANKFVGFAEGIKEYLTNSEPENISSVILHGDCWNNNFMFKYKNGNKHLPTDMRLIDFQLSKIASPVFDLSNYLYSCTDKEVLDHFDLLLKAYHISLSNYLKEFHCNVNDIFPFSELKTHWRKYGKFGLSMAPYLLSKIGLRDYEKNKRLVDVLSHFAEFI